MRPGSGSRTGGRTGGRPGSKPGGRFQKGGRGPRRPGSGPYGGGGRFFRKKVCRFCADRVLDLDYKQGERLIKFITEKGKIIPRRTTGNCAKHQRMLARAIKRARHAAVLAFQTE